MLDIGLSSKDIILFYFIIIQYFIHNKIVHFITIFNNISFYCYMQYLNLNDIINISFY